MTLSELLIRKQELIKELKDINLEIDKQQERAKGYYELASKNVDILKDMKKLFEASNRIGEFENSLDKKNPLCRFKCTEYSYREAMEHKICPFAPICAYFDSGEVYHRELIELLDELGENE